MKPGLSVITAVLALSGCTQAPRSIDAELDANFATGQVLLSCKASSSGTCYAIFVGGTGEVSGQAAVGSTASITLGDGTDYCVDVSTPDPAKCHPRPLAPGKQIVRAATIKSH